MAAQWPLAIAFDQLHHEAAQLGGAHDARTERHVLATAILSLHLGGVAELHCAAPPFVLASGPLPEPERLAALDAALASLGRQALLVR